MITQLGRGAAHETGAPGPADPPSVAVLGQRSRVAGLAQYLPHGWTLRLIAELDEVRPGELLVISGAGPYDVRLARRVLPPSTRIVALIDDWAPAETVAGVLTEGAHVCVRGGHQGILAGHLVACRRRQLAERWTDINLAS
ncbi:hypothetical protein AB0M02_38285 [Actinoplanes sp. NPDC051861]|uniref:hypothetical protein n=1 Tax=Actinoplanes sp. NPDC051861 TaxID=3155170 RepID=UPI003427D2A4